MRVNTLECMQSATAEVKGSEAAPSGTVGMNLAVVSYVPPPKVGYPSKFLANLRKHPTKNRLILFSEHDWGADDWAGGMVRIKGPPDFVRNSYNSRGQVNTFAVNNLVFFTALLILKSQGVTHFIYLEADSRVNVEGWDGIMFDEFFYRPEHFAVGGTMVVYNPSNAGLEASRAYQKLMAREAGRRWPVATYGWKGATDTGGNSAFVNGALGIYDMAWLDRLFTAKELTDTPRLSMESYAFDFEIGHRLWQIFGAEAYRLVCHMDCVYSGYGDQFTTEAERLYMLEQGNVVAVHQVKGDF